jgi:hypothetical protein
MHCCLVCDKYCAVSQWLCPDCQARWGDYEEWPAWLKELKSMAQRYRAQPGGITNAPKDIQIVLLWTGG